MNIAPRWLCIVFLAASATTYADEPVRQVQEELRKRNLYFGDVDGRSSPDFANALKRYQTRKGFAVTGVVDNDTATSLNVDFAPSSDARQATLIPDIPVLRSDRAPEVSETQRLALQKQAEELITDPTPAPPAEAPEPSQDLTPDRVRVLVEQFLRDAETDDITAQVRYFAFPVDYFQDGRRDAGFVEKDTRNYVRRWPERDYELTGPVTFAAGGGEGETNVEFQFAWNVRNKSHAARGRARHKWTIRPEGDDLKIVAIHEERLRE